MLRIVIKSQQLFDEKKQEFHNIDAVVLDLEHSLLSLSKWESEFQKPFLTPEDRTPEEIFGYVRAMILTPNVDPGVLHRCSQADLDRIQSYIDSKESATTFGKMPERRGPGEVITSELIYYWMVAYNIPFEVQTWHLNRLFSLIRICNAKNSKPKKMSRHEAAAERARLNAERRAKMGSSG